MWKFNEVISIKYRGNYVYCIKFDDGVEGDIDFSEYLSRGPVFQSIKDYKVFSKATVEGGTISWPTGADIAPETLYEKLLSAGKPAKQIRKKAVHR
jgi:hypothetical protein